MKPDDASLGGRTHIPMEAAADHMKNGKFPTSLLERLLAKIDIVDDRVLLGPKVGEDVAILDLGDRLLVAKTDPVTLASDLVGWYAVNVNANDIACAGATPHWFMATLLVPEGFTEVMAEEIFDQILEACSSLGVSLVGGHSEVTRTVNQPVIVGCMLGEVAKGKLISTGGALDGDSIVVTKGVALEGTATLARDASDRLSKAGVKFQTIEQARNYLFNPGISVVQDAMIACSTVDVHSLHDPTEGGLLTGLWEIAKASHLGLSVEEGSIPIMLETAEICQALGLDPLGLLASGALVITLSPEDVPSLCTALEKEGIDAYEIGRMMELEEGVTIIRTHELEPLPTFERDELARFLDSAP